MTATTVTTAKNTTAATVAAPSAQAQPLHSVLSQTAQVTSIATTAPGKTTRAVFSLTTGEGLLAFTAAALTWLYLNRSFHTPPSITTLFVLCNVLAASAVCAGRFLRGTETKSVSRLGYLAFGVPAAQAALLAFLNLHSPLWNPVLEPLLLPIFVVLVATQIVASVGASIGGLLRAARRGEAVALGDILAFPSFIAWQALSSVLYR